jgi:2-amino-4-hydroxy-6-hydroxymethyldihydropteridine diphosphokinase
VTRCLIALGSNLGNRRAHLAFAFEALSHLPRSRLLKRSKIRASAPMGKRAGGEFLNAAALIETALSPAGLLVELKRIEARRGRRPGKRWRPRALDLDLLRFGKRRLATRLLTVPHPGIARPFVKDAVADLVQ